MDPRFLLLVVICLSLVETIAFSSHLIASFSRRDILSKLNKAIAGTVAVTLSPPTDATLSVTPRPEDGDIQILQDASDTLASLLDNWEKATLDCTYADVPRELLERKNKEELLEKASKFALFDKSTSVVSCKRTNRIVRDYIGATGKGPLREVEGRMRTLADRVEPYWLDGYIAETEAFGQAMSRAKALSWYAGHADFDSMNNFPKGEERGRDENSNLEQSRVAIVEAKVALDRVIELLLPSMG